MSTLPATFSTHILFKLSAVQKTLDAFDTPAAHITFNNSSVEAFSEPRGVVLQCVHSSQLLLVCCFFLNKFNETHI